MIPKVQVASYDYVPESSDVAWIINLAQQGFIHVVGSVYDEYHNILIADQDINLTDNEQEEIVNHYSSGELEGPQDVTLSSGRIIHLIIPVNR